MTRMQTAPTAERVWEEMETALDPRHAPGPVRVLFATDGSENAEAAERLLAQLPLPVGSRIRVVTAFAGVEWETPEWVLASQYRWGKELTGRAAERLAREGVEVETGTRIGGIAYEILAAAEELDADLIVLGSKGLTGLAGFMLGSVARNVAKHARRPVLVAREPRNHLRGVVLAADESEHAGHAAGFAARLPLPPETQITVCHVVRPYVPYVGTEPFYPDVIEATVAEVRRQRRHGAERLVEEVARRLESGGRQAAVEVREGDPASEILRVAEERKADLVIAGARGQSLIQGLLVGSVADRLLKGAHCSVLLVH